MKENNQLLNNYRSVFTYLEGDLELDVSNGLCTTHDDPDLWFAGEVEQVEGEVWRNTKDQRRRYQAEVDKAVSAIAVCNNCPAKNDCLQLGLRGFPQIMFGIYGGTMPGERMAMLGKVNKNPYNRMKVSFANRVRKTMRERGYIGG
jgi:hypothetical protein